MFSLNLHSKLFQIKQIVADSAALFVFLHKIHVGYLKNQTSMRFCSLVNVELSGVFPRTGEKKPQISENLGKEKLFTVSYLTNSCGLSPETAVSLSEKVCFKNSENPNFVLDLLEKNGFSKTQIAAVVWKRPRILLAREKTLLPKFKFFQSIGMSKDYIAVMISRDPSMLFRSLANQIIPNYKFLKSILLTDERVATSVKRTSGVFGSGLVPNVEFLRAMKVPTSCLKLLLSHYPETLTVNCDDFRATVSKVSEMGFDPSKSTFMLGLHAVSGNTNQVTWAKCYEAYCKWGWSKDDIYMAFRKQPNCMLMSQKKIHSTMEFLVNKMGLNSRMIAKTPTVLLLSLENRIIPRCSVVKVLSLRGLMDKDIKITTVLLPVQKHFLERFVVKYENKVPQLRDLYKGKIRIEEF